ncbi:MAG TPA: CehA/McbA family metallohydrolase, partial [Bryobacteraceae bacterium]|nr:CehA/McbA family metallohydrolase [Bryobacteraceae bacterium]
LNFNGDRNDRERSLFLRQTDVKAVWSVALNGVALGTLFQDERDMALLLPVPAGVLRAGANELRIAGKPSSFSDDIQVRDIRIHDASASDLQREATVDVTVTGDDRGMPVRITVVDDQGSLVPLRSLRADAYEAVRTGVIYSADGRARIGLPAGGYRVYASRGFEYSAPSSRVRVTAGEQKSVALRVRREVDMSGYTSVDTHVHTLELSGHGDASVEERVLTAAGEGLEVMVATEHNRLSDYSGAIRKRGMERWVESIPGTEVTTPIGPFNVFTVLDGTPYPNAAERDWSKLSEAVKRAAGSGVIVQNHPRDEHSGYRPFDPAHHVSGTGENLIGRPLFANAMEVVNSGAMAPDPLQLVRDWMGLLTRGDAVAAIGASDTHTVDFVPIAQARTYVERGNGPSDVVAQLAAGRNLVSYGLAVDVRQMGPPVQGFVPVRLAVMGPSWAAAGRVAVYSNGAAVWSKNLGANRRPGRKFQATVRVPVPAHDAALVAVVTGPPVLQPFWEVRKPYQLTSDEWTTMVLGVSRALWIDCDGSGKREAPLHHARQLVEKYKGDANGLKQALRAYDESVAAHVRRLL